MNQMLEFYEQQAKQKLSVQPWLAQMQSKALKDLAQHGFPRRHDEEWKYTSVDALLQHAFVANDSAPQASLKASDIPVRHSLFIDNGAISGAAQLASLLPSGVIILPLAEAIIQHPELLKPHLGRVLQQEHGFHFANTALIHSGLFIFIPQGICIEEPIALIHRQNKANQAVHIRHLIIAEARSQVTLVEEYAGATDCSYLTNTVSEVVLGDQAQVTHYKIQRESKKAYHLGHLSVRQAQGSQLFSHVLSLGGALARSDISLYLQGEQAHSLMNGIYAPCSGQHMDHHTSVQHLLPNCSSEQDYKGILSGRSKAVFNGKVLVAKNAQHSNAKQQNKNLLLDTSAEIATKPQLEIFADDVLCSHGATVGQLDEEALFYLATRGIDQETAAQYLIHAFAQDNIRLIPHQALADWMSRLLTQQVG